MLFRSPLSSKVFYRYVQSKYPDIETTSEIHHYEKIRTQYDYNTQTETVDVITIDEATYNSLVESSNEYELNTGLVRVDITKRPVSIYDYELAINDSKKTISILNKKYVDQMEMEFQQLMAV